MPTIRTTMRPDVEIEVGDAEFLDLTRQGLIAADQPTTATTPPAEPASQPAGKKTSAATATDTTKEG